MVEVGPADGDEETGQADQKGGEEVTKRLEGDERTTAPKIVDGLNQLEEGRRTLEEPQLLPGLTLQSRVYTAEERHELYQNISFVYTFANGSEINHVYRRRFLDTCGGQIRDAEKALYNRTRLREGGVQEHPMLRCWPDKFLFPKGTPPQYKPKGAGGNRTEESVWYSNQEIYDKVSRHAKPENRDRESDEFRYSFRSVEAHIKWHRGPLLSVTPGHHPWWVDNARNFLSASCERREGVHQEFITIHQDALIPYGLRYTKSSYAIETFLYRVKNLTGLHVYFNDDYFVQKDVAVTDFVNPYGGPILRTEAGLITRGDFPDKPNDATWARTVRRTNAFNIIELDEQREDYLPDETLNFSVPVSVNVESYLDWAILRSPPPIDATVNHKPRRHRRYATHAPFVYCTKMFNAVAQRYAREFSHNVLEYKSRSAWSYSPPFIHHAFVMARPWIASNNFFPYLLSRQTDKSSTMTISLDNNDGCAPAELRGGIGKSRCKFVKFKNNMTENEEAMRTLETLDILFFNINGGFNTEEVARQLQETLQRKYPNPSYLEKGAHAGDEVLQEAFRSLVKLPVVLVVDYAEGACALLRSLQLSLPEHQGQVHILINSGGRPTLYQERQRLAYHFCSVRPSLRCAYDSEKVTLHWNHTLEGQNWSTLVGDRADGVTLPASCGESEKIRAIVLDARAGPEQHSTPPWIREAIAIPGQTLLLHHFGRLSLSENGGTALYLSRHNNPSVHWVTGGCESDLLFTFPLPYPRYENMSATAEFI
ncbi:hypothetical protein AGDE_07522 [Angomonas deanei]|nr:hypothetical protein AGDE_07522 [Angomonas deanei]|eukprot:EPY35231.1 hypothetical protein AGDE_07522 [Angomonas deanei]